MKVGEVVTVLQQTAQYVVVEWRSDPIADMVADAVLAIILRLDDGSGAAVGGKAGVKVRVRRHPPGGLLSQSGCWHLRRKTQQVRKWKCLAAADGALRVS